MKKLVAVVLVCGSVFALTGCETLNRMAKSIQSDTGGGLYRTITVYDYSGNAIKTYSGKFDMSESENEIYFDLDGKRVIIHGGIVINEEN